MGGFQLNELEMTVIFVSTGVSTGLMVDKMMKVAPGGLVVPLLPKQTQLQVQNPRLDVDFGVFIALRAIKKKNRVWAPRALPTRTFFSIFLVFPISPGLRRYITAIAAPKAEVRWLVVFRLCLPYICIRAIWSIG